MNTFDMYCTLCGGGPEGDRIAGALAGLHDVLKKRFKGYAGTSIGGIIATLAAFGISDDQIRRLFCAYLQDNFILDPHWSSLAKLQLLNWERISELSEKTLGKNAKMGDAQFIGPVGHFGFDIVAAQLLQRVGDLFAHRRVEQHGFRVLEQ